MIPWGVPSDKTTSEEHKRIALTYLTEAWIEAVKDGVDPESMAEAVLEAALRELIALRGEPAMIEAFDTYRQRIETGEFSTYATRQ